MGSNLDNVINNKLENIEKNENSFSCGSVRMVRQYVVESSGLSEAFYFEKVTVGDGNEGYVDAINRDSVHIALTKINSEINIGDRVVATGDIFTCQYSEDSFGHVIDMFGYDRMADKQLENLSTLPVEADPIPIMDRTSVVRPFPTGIGGIDLLCPIGKGQRQLIIGDKKIGKTQICLDTIVNQRGKDVICIYTAIGKTKKEVKEVYSKLFQHDAMSYTIILAAFNDDSAPVLKNTPYAAISIANKYMMEGKDVLVVIDDLKRHADVCREIALLMGKMPGRDAYPTDIFYAHSRMLEMGCQHKDGGSITILPICETKGGDITDYISTNVISITDGQIVLSTSLFEKGQKPAIDYGLSVSRLGGNVQTEAMRKTGIALRRELLAYLEQQEVFELANMDEMSEAMRSRMKRGSRITAMLKQGKFAVKSSERILEEVRALEH